MFKKRGLLAALGVYIICFALLYPFYQYIFDDDGVGYLMITKRLAAGDFYNGINGFWSPLHSWLVVPLYKAGLSEFLAFRISNGLIGAGILIVVYRLCKKTALPENIITATLWVCIPVILSLAFKDLAADILVCLLLLIYTDIVSEKDFFESPGKNILAGITGCLCYLAKTYAFPFFMIHFAAVQFILFKRCYLANKKKLFVRNLLLGIASCILLAIPWLIMLQDRYDTFTFGFSGRHNYMLALFPGYSSVEELVAVPPEPLVSFWENPYYLPAPKDPYPSLLSFDVLIVQIRVFLNSFMVALNCFHNLSFLSTAIILILGIYVLKRKDNTLTIFLLTITLLPLGYLLMHIETRFIWSNTFLLLVAGMVLLNELFKTIRFTRLWQLTCYCIVFGSFLIVPVNYLKDNAGNGKDIFTLAGELKEKGVSGRYLSDIDGYSETRRLAYLTGNTDCIVTNTNYSYNELLAASRKKNIDYYFFFYRHPYQLEAFKQTVFYRNALREIGTGYPGLLLLKMQ